MTLPPGTRLGRYEVRTQLGASGMGEVYLARDTTRFIVTEFVEDESLRQMMTRERPTLREALSRAAIAAAPQAGKCPPSCSGWWRRRVRLNNSEGPTEWHTKSW